MVCPYTLIGMLLVFQSFLEEVEPLVSIEQQMQNLVSCMTVLFSQSTLSIEVRYTLKCLKIGTPKTINFPFVPNGKLMIFRCPST